MKLSTKVVATGIATLLSAGVLAGAAEAATKEVRQADFIPQLSDTRATGHLDFLREGLRMFTEGTTSTDKVAEYFRPIGSPTALPSTVSYEWTGTDAQPGAQIVFSATGSAGNATGTNILVGEQIYSTNPAGANLTEWWYPGGTARAATNSITCPLTTGGTGSDCHGTLAQWKASNPTAAPLAYGFSLGSGVKGAGLLRAMTYDGDVYEFTDTPAATPVAVTGSVKVKQPGHKVKLIFTSDPTPAGKVQGAKLNWKIKVDGKSMPGAKLTQGAGETDKWLIRFPAHQKHKVQVYKNGAKVLTVKVK